MNKDSRGFGLIVIGDELLQGGRRDRHLEHFRELLRGRGLGLAWCWILPDQADVLAAQLRRSMGDGLPVFCCGGIGATPDDLTRQCAARAAGVPLERHPGALAEIEGRFGADAWPHRVLMADLPQGCGLIPNPQNRIPGFSLNRHWFLPGFPELAWPMAEWVLDTHFPQAGTPIAERAVWVEGVAESALLPLMESLQSRFPGLKLFSLPRLGARHHVELGFRGREGLDQAFAALLAELNAAGLPYRDPLPGDDA
jgi:molybdopterin-biosynthesis enzyme MoeA-like protein